MAGTVQAPPTTAGPPGRPPVDDGVVTPADRPVRPARIDGGAATELVGSVVASGGTIWVLFSLTGTSAPFGFGVAWILCFVVVYALLCRFRHGPITMKDRLATVVIWVGALVALVPLVWVIGYVIVQGAPVVFAHFPHFLYADMTQLTATSSVSAVGAGPAIVGTVEQVLLATVATVPIGILTATYLVDHDDPLARVVAYVVDAMTGAPAIIAGLFVYLLIIAPHIASKSGFACAMALAVMMLPIVTRTAQEVIGIVPGSLREASLALGSPQWRSIMRVVLPTARAGLITAVILGVARIAGETAPVLFVAGGNSRYNWNPFYGQQDNLPFRIYQLIFQPSVNATRDAWGVSFVLVMVILILFVLARLAGVRNPSRVLTPWRMVSGPAGRRRADDEPPAAPLVTTGPGAAPDPLLLTDQPFDGGDTHGQI